jgi:hypothetical protein
METHKDGHHFPTNLGQVNLSRSREFAELENRPPKQLKEYATPEQRMAAAQYDWDLSEAEYSSGTVGWVRTTDLRIHNPAL